MGKRKISFYIILLAIVTIIGLSLSQAKYVIASQDKGFVSSSPSYSVPPSGGFESESGMACYTVVPVSNSTKEGTYQNLLKVVNNTDLKNAYGFDRSEIIKNLKSAWSYEGFSKFILFYGPSVYDSDYVRNKDGWRRFESFNFWTMAHFKKSGTRYVLDYIPAHYPTFDTQVNFNANRIIQIDYSYGAMARGGNTGGVGYRYNYLSGKSFVWGRLINKNTYDRDKLTDGSDYSHDIKMRNYIIDRCGIDKDIPLSKLTYKSIKNRYDDRYFLEMYHIYKFRHNNTKIENPEFWNKQFVKTVTTFELLMKWSIANNNYSYLEDMIKRFLFSNDYSKKYNYIILWTPLVGRADYPIKGSNYLSARFLAHAMTYTLAHHQIPKKVEAELPDKMTSVFNVTTNDDNIFYKLGLGVTDMAVINLTNKKKKSLKMFANPIYNKKGSPTWYTKAHPYSVPSNHYMTFGLQGGEETWGVKFIKTFNTKHKDTGGNTLPFQTFDYIELGKGKEEEDVADNLIMANAKFYKLGKDRLEEHSSLNSSLGLITNLVKDDKYIGEGDTLLYINFISLNLDIDSNYIRNLIISTNLYNNKKNEIIDDSLFNIKALNAEELKTISDYFDGSISIIDIGKLKKIKEDTPRIVEFRVNNREDMSYKIDEAILETDVVKTIIIPLKIELKKGVNKGTIKGDLNALIFIAEPGAPLFSVIDSSEIYNNSLKEAEYEYKEWLIGKRMEFSYDSEKFKTILRKHYTKGFNNIIKSLGGKKKIKNGIRYFYNLNGNPRDKKEKKPNTSSDIPKLPDIVYNTQENMNPLPDIIIKKGKNVAPPEAPYNTNNIGYNREKEFNPYMLALVGSITPYGIQDYVKIKPVESKNLFTTDLKIKDVVISDKEPRYIDVLWEFKGIALDKGKISNMLRIIPDTGKTHLAKATISVSQPKPGKNSKWNIDTSKTKIYPLDSTFTGYKITEDISKYYTDTISINTGESPNKLLSGKIKVDKTNYESCSVLSKGESNISYDKNGKIHFGTNYYAGDVWNDDIAFTLYSKTGDKYKTNYGKTVTDSEDIVNDLEDISFKFITRLTPKGDWLKNETKKIGSASGDVLRKKLEYNFVYKMKANMELKLFEYDPKVSSIDTSTMHASNKSSNETSILDKLLGVITVKANDKIKDLIDDPVKEKDLNKLYKVKSKADGKTPTSHSVYDSISKKKIKVKEIKNIQGIYRKYNTSEKLKYKDEATITDNVGNGEESTVETRSYIGHGKFGVFTGISYGKEGVETLNIPPAIFVEEPFEYHSTLAPRFYSELKANEPLNEDWNALEGVPSDERLFVASGGEKFQIDVSGITKKQDNITRRITFNVVLQDSWENNIPNVLTPHIYRDSDSEYAKISAAGDGEDEHTFKDGGKIKVKGSWNTDEDGNDVPETNYNEGEWSWSVSFDDSTGKITFNKSQSPGGSIDIVEGEVELNDWGQVYEMKTATVIKVGKASKIFGPFLHPNILDDGYTTGKGSVVSTRNTNMLNPSTQNGTRTITEKIDRIIYLNIKDYAINGLYKNELSDANADVFEDSANGNSVGNPLQALVYNIKDDGLYESMNGRLWFTKPVKDTWKEGGPGWKNTTVNEHYWLGDMVVNITIIPDNDYALKNDGKLHTDSIRDNAGATEDKWRWEPTEVSQLARDYFNGKNYIGDRTDKNGTLSKMVNATINRWLKANESDKYTVHVVSDAMSIGTTSGNKYQDIVASIYPVDDGINIFKTPFSDGITNIDVQHKCRNINKAVLFDKGEYSMQTVFGDDEISVDGYNGVISSVYLDKYMGVKKVQDKETVKPIVQSLNNESWLKEKFPDGMPYNLGSPEYTNTGETYGYNNPRFVAKSTLVETPNGNGVTYNGYYQDYDLGCAMGVNVSNVQFGEVRDTPEITDNSYTNSGAANIAKYDIPLVMTNLDLKDRDARNGSYISPITSKGYYGLMLSKYETSAKDSWDKRTLELTGKYTDNFINEDNDEDKINSIIVHTPVSVEYSRIIPYKDQLVTDDHKDEYDLRIEKTINKYSLVGDFTEIFYSPIGDFHDPSGRDVDTHIRQPRGMGLKSKHVSCAKPSRYIVEGWDGYRKESLSKAYTDQMDTTRWTDTTFLMTPYPYYYFNTAGEKVSVPPNVKVDLSTFGDKSKRKATVISNDKSAGVPGYVLSIFVLTSANEMISGQVKLFSNAINKEDPKSEDVANPENTNKERIGYNAFHDSRFIETIDVVGRLGNMSMSDTEDFRFSNMFREPIDKWRIPNIIRDVDLNTPNMVVADSKNILCKPVPFGGMGHTTQGMTYFSDKEIEKNAKPWNKGIAKANENYISFPLTPAKNNVPELRNSPMRMGYAMFLDIETIGNYHSDSNDMNFKQQGIEISPYYMLYDLDKKEYLPIDIYYGNSVNKEKLYSYGEKIPSPNYTYNINVAEEFGRRNISEVETKTTDEIMKPLMKFGTMKTYDIGTPSDIFLNGLSRNFIGSSVLESGIAMDNGVPKVVGETGITNYQNSYNNKNNWSWSYGTDKERLSEGEFQVQGQRWYWKLGLPSSAMIVPHGPIPTGSSVEKENQKLKNKRKNSIIVCTANIIAHGEVWKLQYNNKLMNNGEITVFEENNKKVKIPVPGIVEGVNHEKFAVINVYDAWETAASDKSVRGTH